MVLVADASMVLSDSDSLQASSQAPLLGSSVSRSSNLLQAGEIYQEFTADGQVFNIIQASVPFILEEGMPHDQCSFLHKYQGLMSRTVNLL